MSILEIIRGTLASSGFATMTPHELIMIFTSFVLLYLALVKRFEPMLLIPISFGMLLANIPEAGLMFDATSAAQANLEAAIASGDFEAIVAANAALSTTHWYDSGIIQILYSGVKSGLFPCLIIMGVGAMTDFGPLIANPSSIFLGAAAQIGIYMTFILAIAIGIFTPQEAASIAIIGGADGPTSIYLTGKLAPELLGPVAVAAYSYMALIPLIQPPIMRLLTTQKEREVKMEQLRIVNKAEKIVFPIAITVISLMLLPSISALIGMFMLGNLFRECGIVDRLSDVSQNALMNIVTILLGVSVGATANGTTFLQVQTIAILVLGLVSFALSTAAGVLFGKLMCFLTKGKVNPLIGSSGVSAIPMAARVSQLEGRKANPSNFLLMHAMGPNVAGVLGSAVAAGLFLLLFGS